MMSKPLRVLIVEDSEDDAALMVRELRRNDYDLTYERVEDAAAMQAALVRKSWDVVVSDYTMPRFSAPAALALLHESRIDLPFIIISGTIGEDTAVAAMRAGAHDFLIKGQLARLAPVIERELSDARVRRQRRQAEQALLEKEQYFRALIENVSDIITTLKATSRIGYVSPAITRILGYTPAEYMDHDAFDLIHPDDRQEIRTSFARLLEQPGSSNMTQFRAKHEDGSWRWLESTSRNLLHEPGVQAVVANMRDITERKRAEIEREQLLRQIQNQAREVQFIVDTVPEGMFLLNEDGYVQLRNSIAEEFLTLLAPDWEDSRLAQLGQHPLAELLTSPPKGLWHEVEGNGRFFEVIARPVEVGPSQRGWVFVLRDVTQERQIQRQVQSQERMAAVGQLAAGIAHDFNNSLAIIKLYTDLLLRSTEWPDRIQEQLRIVARQTQRAADLIQQILDFSRQSLMEKQPLDLLPFLKELIRLLKRTLPEDIQIKLNVAQNEYFIQADPSRIQQVILNLAFNARDAMPQGGKLIISLKALALASEADYPVAGMKPGEWVQLTVTDNGAGMTPETLNHIFEPFFTTKERGKGTGLGLAQVYGIVQRHEGFIDVVTEVNRGTAVYLYFPSFSIEQYDTVRLPEAETPRGEGQLVLIVEDETAIRQALVESLTLLNYKVMEASNGREALTLLALHGDEIDLVLSDVIMPEMGGIALFHALQEREVVIPFIMMTGYAVEKDVENLRALGLQSWLTKPPDLDKLAQVLYKSCTY
jgi:PAS domain S-box-containing protein